MRREGMDARSRPAQAHLHGCSAFGELSGSAELTEGRAVVERRLEQAAEEGAVGC